MAAVFAFLYHLAAFGLVAALVIEFILVNGALTAASARTLQRADIAFGVAAGVVLLVGLLRVFFFEKGAAYYFDSPYFIAKPTLFVIVGLLSIVPTLEFLSWRTAVRQRQVPAVSDRRLRTIRAIVRGELAGIVLLILCAALMAKGGWG